MRRGWALEKKAEFEAAQAAVKEAEERAAIKDKQKEKSTSSGGEVQDNHTLCGEASKSRG